MTEIELINHAKDAAKYSYAPYSSFNVGAALLTKSGKIFTGCNIENVSFSPTCCAERVAVFKAVSEGERDFSAIAIVGGKKCNFEKYCPPCGVCRQILREFCNDDFKIILGKNDEEFKIYSLDEILPLSFSDSNINS